jgi:hypothetical protein
MIYHASNFSLDSLQLMTPKPMDNYFLSNLSTQGEEILLQTPKCTSKQGIVTSSNKKCIDFVFTQSSILSWIVSLEERVQQLIYEKRNLWFMEDTIDMDDIQQSFVSVIKPKGDMYTVRAYLPVSEPILFNEAKLPIEESSIKETTTLVGILHFVGIRFNQQSFQMILQVKQLMSISLPTKCLIELEADHFQSLVEKDEIKRMQIELEELRRNLKK